MYDLRQLIECYRCPQALARMYWGDIGDDTIEALEDFEAMSGDDGSDIQEVFCHVPGDDEFDDLIDILEGVQTFVPSCGNVALRVRRAGVRPKPPEPLGMISGPLGFGILPQC